jgi:AraC-like DNA-binding protein
MDAGRGAFRAPLIRGGYFLALPEDPCSTDVPIAANFMMMLFPANTFREILKPGEDFGSLHSGLRREELPLQITEYLWSESHLVTSLEADCWATALAATLVRIARRDTVDELEGHATSQSRLRRLSAYVEEHLAEDIRVTDLSRITGGSLTECISGIRKATGYTPWQFVLARRLEKAKTFLLSDTHSITEIAIECGFSSSQHFATTFKKYMQTTPSEYRRQRRR